MRKIAVTGGLSCGKSSVCQILKQLGAYVVSADDIVHRQLSPNTRIGKRIIDLLGPDILINDGAALDRNKIAQKVFHNNDLLKTLESWLHPVVFEEITREYEKVRKEGQYALFVAEVPLLYEEGFEKLFDAVVVVTTDEALAKERFVKSRAATAEEYSQRRSKQWEVAEKMKRTPYVVTNNGSRKELFEKVKTLLNLLKDSA